MDRLEHPSKLVWDQRRKWFEQLFDVDAYGGGYIIGEHTSDLLVDLQIAYCARAFVSTIIMACTIIDAHLRYAELDPTFNGSIQQAFSASGYKSDLEWLRKRRNEFVHYKANQPFQASAEGQWSGRDAIEADAQRAVELVPKVLFENPWV